MISIDLSNFDTSSVTNMNFMFSHCEKLTSLNINNFKTTNLKEMQDFVSYCYKLTSIDFSSFDTSNVINMRGIFYESKKLVYLDLKNFVTSSVTNFVYTFSGLQSLIFLNLKNFKKKNDQIEIDNAFSGISSNVKYCIEDVDTKNFLLGNKNVNCSDICFQDNIKIQNNKCVCNDINKFEYHDKCYQTCPQNTKPIKQNKYTCTIEKLENYYLDNNEHIYKECYQKCNKCSKLGDENNNNCDECKNNYRFYNEDSLKANNCYLKCENKYYIIKNNEVSCVNSCEQEYNKLIEQKNKCIDNCQYDNKYIYEYNNKCYEECPSGMKTDIEEKKCYNSCHNYKFEYKNKCYSDCPYNTYRVFNNRNICLDTKPDNYYKDNNDNIYKECYERCKKCSKFGDADDNNCDECKNDFTFVEDTSLKENNCYEKCENYYYINENKKYNCVNSCPDNYNKLIEPKKKCIDNCQKDNKYIYEYNNKCLEECPSDTKTDVEEKKCYISCHEYKFEYNNTCLSDCPNNTYRVFMNRNICLKSINESYYLDERDKIYKLCFKNCQKCYGEGNKTNNNCIECKNGFILLKDPNIENNCFECNNLYYIDGANTLHCTEDYNCIPNHKKYVLEKSKCINLCQNDNIYNLEYNGNCLKNCPNGTFASDNNICHNNNASITEICEQENQGFIEAVLSRQINFDNLTENNSIVSKEITNGVILSAGTTDTIKKNFNDKVSSIDLGKCEDEIKQFYNISLNQSLIIVKSDFKSNYSLIPKVGYQIIDPNTLKLLNLSNCQTNEAKLYYPVVIDVSNLFLFDPNSDFYNDNCFVYTTENGTDIILKDRQKEFIYKNLSLCDNNCIFMDYDSVNKQSICACEIQNKAETISDLINNPNQIPKEFITNDESKKSANMMPIKCLSLSGLKNNIASYLLLFICLYFLLSLLYFMKCGFYLLKSEVDKILAMKEKDIIKKTENQITQGNSKREKGKNNYPPKRGGIRFINNEIQNKRYHRVLRSDINSITKSYNKFNVFKTDKEKEINDNKQNKIKTAKKKGKKGNINYKFNFNDYELNTMSYSEAIIFDKRTCFEYYISLIKTKHPVYFGFCCINDYNLFIIKSSMFFLSFAVCFAVNYFFFNEDIIHKIYEQGGKYDILFFIPTICISFSVYHILTIIIKLVFLSERNLLEIKMQKTHREANAKSYDVLCCLRIKHIFYFSLGIIFISIFWLFLSSFSAVYQNTQIILAKNTIISFSISFIYPFIMNIIPCLFRICSLSGNNQYLYNVSKFFQLI